MTDLKELIERVEKATGPDRELDAAIFRAMGEPLPDEFMGVGVSLTWTASGRALMALPGGMQVAFEPPSYTASTDAALALTERMLPGWTHGHQKFPDGEIFNSGGYQFFVAEDAGDLDSGYASGEAPTLPLAIVLATLRALQEQK